MRLKSFIMRYDFCMWNSWCFRIEVWEDESEEVSEQLIDSFFIDFDVISSVAIVRCESLDETNREDIFAENIWLRDVAEKVDEANCEVSEANEQKTADFSMTLYVDSNATTRKSELLTDFRAWFWRKCSWNLLLKLKFCLQCLQITRTQTIRWIDAFFTRSDVILSVAIERFEHFDETNCKDILVSVTRFLDVAKKIDDFCEKDEHAIADFFSDSHTDLSVLIERWKSLTRFRASCSRMCSKSSSLKLKFCLQDLHIARAHATPWIDAFFIVSDIVTNVFNERFKRDAFNLVNK